MSTDDTHIVYAAELMAMQMATTLFEEKICEYANVHIFTDSQATIQAIESPKHQSGQYIIKRILDKIDSIHELKSSGNIYIEWVSDHKNVQGNELADQAAKTAVASNIIRSITRMKSAQNQINKSHDEDQVGNGIENWSGKCKMSPKDEQTSWHCHGTQVIWRPSMKTCSLDLTATNRPLSSQ